MSTDSIDEKAVELAVSKLGVRGERTAPEVVERRSGWSPVLLRNLDEVEVRSGAGSLIARIDADTEETVGWRYSDRPIRAEEVRLTEEEAVAIAQSEIDIPPTAVLQSVDFVDRGAPGVMCSVRWMRVVDGLEVEGDFVYVKINPETREVISATKNWSEV